MLQIAAENRVIPYKIPCFCNNKNFSNFFEKTIDKSGIVRYNVQAGSEIRSAVTKALAA